MKSINGDYTLLMYRPYHVLCPLQERDDGRDLVLHRQQTTTLDLNRLQLELGRSHVFTTGSQVRPKSLDFLRIKNIQKGFFLIRSSKMKQSSCLMQYLSCI